MPRGGQLCKKAVRLRVSACKKLVCYKEQCVVWFNSSSRLSEKVIAVIFFPLQIKKRLSGSYKMFVRGLRS